MPAPTIFPNGVDASQIAILANNLAADGTLDVQYGPRPDFMLGVSPLVTGVAKLANFNVHGLNSGTTYFIRVRSRRASGAVEDWSNTIIGRTSDVAGRVTAPNSVMIEPALLVVPEKVVTWNDFGTGVAGYPIANLAHDGPTAWVSKLPATDIHVFTAEIGPVPIDTIALLNSNAAADATVMVKAGNSTAGAEHNAGNFPFRASAYLPGRPGYHSLIRLPAPQKWPYWRIEITSTNFGRQFQLEHAIFGLNRATKNHSVDKTESAIDLGTLDRTRGGNPVRTIGHRGRRVDFDISVLTEAQYETAYADLDWRVGQTEPVLCVPNSKANAFLHDRILYGPIRGGKVVNPASPRYTRGFTIDSLI